MMDVAQKASVTKTTVSMVLRNKPGISQATRDRVLLAARELRYRPSLTRQTRGRLHCGQIGFLIVNDLPPRLGKTPEGKMEGAGGSYLYQMTMGAMAYADQMGDSMTLSHMTSHQVIERVLPTTISRHHVDGLLIRSSAQTSVLIDQLQELEIPFVLLDCECTLGNTTQVLIDNMLAMRQLVSYLHHRGSRRFATITGDIGHLNAQERLAGLQVALTGQGLCLENELQVMETGFDEASGERGAKLLLERWGAFDTLICQNDLIAAGAFRIFADAGKGIPDDVCLAGFDNMDFGRHLPVSLTSVDSQPYQIGQTGARLLLEMIQNGVDHHLHVRIPTELVVRESS